MTITTTTVTCRDMGPEIRPVDHTPWTKPIRATVETVRMAEEIKAAKKGEDIKK